MMEVCTVTEMCVVLQCVMMEVCAVTEMCVVLQCRCHDGGVCCVSDPHDSSDRVRGRVSRHDGLQRGVQGTCQHWAPRLCYICLWIVRIVLVRLTCLSVSHCADAAQEWK